MSIEKVTVVEPLVTKKNAMNQIKDFVEKSLTIPKHLYQYWDILDVYPKEEPELALAHYNELFDPYNRSHEPLRKIRGVIVDLTTGAKVCDSHGYTQSLTCYDKLNITKTSSDPSGTISFTSDKTMYYNTVENAPEESPKFNIGERSFDAATTRLFVGYEGVMVRLFKWKGKVFFSTHKRIDGTNSFWGGRRKFLDIYNELHGPDVETMFGQEMYSPYCHLFLVVHNDLRLASSTRDNRIFYVGAMSVWDTEKFASEDGPYYSKDGVDLKLPNFEKETKDMFSTDYNRVMIKQPSVDIDTANKFLFPEEYAKELPINVPADLFEIVVEYTKDGSEVSDVYSKKLGRYNTDDRMNGGDFVIAYTKTSEGNTVVYRLESNSFVYRVQITGNDPNMYHRFVIEMPNFTKGDPKELKSKYPLFTDDQGQPLDLVTPFGRQTLWHNIFYYSVPPAYRKSVDGYYRKYMSDIRVLATFIMYEAEKITDEEELKRINNNTKDRYRDTRMLSHILSNSQNRSPRDALLSILYKETGPSLYKMISTMNSIKKYRESKQTVSE